MNAHAILYADRVTLSMQRAIDETSRRRRVQETYNKEHGVTPQGVQKMIRDITQHVRVVAEARSQYESRPASQEEVARLIKDLASQMHAAAKDLEFEKAAMLRDRIVELRKGEREEPDVARKL